MTKNRNKAEICLESGVIIHVEDKFIEIHIGYGNIECEEFDAYLDYTMYDSNFKDLDGGQLDYKFNEIDYENNPELAIEEVFSTLSIDTSATFNILTEDEEEAFLENVSNLI